MPSSTPVLPQTHRVVACQGGDETRLETRPIPSLDSGELLLRTDAVGLCGTDLFKLATGSVSPGQVLGHELVGTIVSIGGDSRPNEHKFQLGDRIAVPHHVPCGQCAQCQRGSETLCATFRENLLEPGGFAEFVRVRPRAVAVAARRVPDSLADDRAVWMEPAACVLRGVRRAGLQSAALAVIQGAGSMGLLHLLVLKALYPALGVVVVDHVEHRTTLAKRLGAIAGVTPNAAPAAVMDLSQGLGANAVFDTVGGAKLLNAALSLSREGGRVILFAHAGDGEKAEFDINALFKNERQIIGSYSGTPDEQAEIFQLLGDGRLDPSPLVTHRLPLEEFAKGVELVKAREALKVIYTFTASDGN